MKTVGALTRAVSLETTVCPDCGSRAPTITVTETEATIEVWCGNCGRAVTANCNKGKGSTPWLPKRELARERALRDFQKPYGSIKPPKCVAIRVPGVRPEAKAGAGPVEETAPVLSNQAGDTIDGNTEVLGTATQVEESDDSVVYTD